MTSYANIGTVKAITNSASFSIVIAVKNRDIVTTKSTTNGTQKILPIVPILAKKTITNIANFGIEIAIKNSGI